MELLNISFYILVFAISLYRLIILTFGILFGRSILRVMQTGILFGRPIAQAAEEIGEVYEPPSEETNQEINFLVENYHKYHISFFFKFILNLFICIFAYRLFPNPL